MSKQLPFNSETVWESARSFHDAARVLERQARLTETNLRTTGGALTAELVQKMTGEKAVPVVLHALALELALKARLKKRVRAHNHFELFTMLPEAERKALAARYAKRRNKMFRSTTLEYALKWSGDAFVEWRYRHEGAALAVSVGEMLLAYEIIQESN